MTNYNKPNQKRVTTNQVRASFIFIVFITVFGALMLWPSSPGWFGKFKLHLGLDLQGGTHLVYKADVSGLEDSLKKDGVEALRDVIERRVNAYGVSEPLIQTNYSGDNYRIIVELAGVKDINEAVSIIDKTPLLEFKIQGEETPVDPEQVDENRQRAEDLLQRALDGEDFAQLATEYSEDPVSAVNGGDLGWQTEGNFVPQFDQAIFYDLKVGQISPELVESQYGYHIIKKEEEKLNDQGQIEVRSSHILIQSAPKTANWVDSGLTGKDIKKAQLAFDPQTQEPLVLVTFNDQGKEAFAELTKEHLGEPIAIFLDGYLRSSPVVQDVIADGEAQITGNFTIQEAKTLVKDLNLGALPVPIEIISQQTVGATLGKISVEKSLLAGMIGIIAAALFMLLFYRLPGFLSVLALGIYTILSLAIFESFNVVLTLAGVAGFILSIGMAVDANVLIFERTKEELKGGRSLNTAIENGFSRAWPSIRDSNVSSIITCLILAWFGTSIIKGFAITLAIGIMVSMFSAITVTRTFLRIIVNKKIENKLFLFGVKRK